jgi:hypothetical protein
MKCTGPHDNDFTAHSYPDQPLERLAAETCHPHLGSGSIVASEIEVPNMLVNPL